MYRDRLAQHRQCDPRFVETADSFARAVDAQRHDRAELLEMWLIADPAGFDLHFLQFYGEDSAIVLFLSDAATSRGLSLIRGKVQ